MSYGNIYKVELRDNVLFRTTVVVMCAFTEELAISGALAKTGSAFAYSVVSVKRVDNEENT